MLAAPDSRAPLLLRCMLRISPASRLILSTLSALQGQRRSFQGMLRAPACHALDHLGQMKPVHEIGRTHLRILNQRRSKRRRLKGSFAPYRSASSIRGGKKAMKSNTFQIVVSVRILLSASCVHADHCHAQLSLSLAC